MQSVRLYWHEGVQNHLRAWENICSNANFPACLQASCCTFSSSGIQLTISQLCNVIGNYFLYCFSSISDWVPPQYVLWTELHSFAPRSPNLHVRLGRRQEAGSQPSVSGGQSLQAWPVFGRLSEVSFSSVQAACLTSNSGNFISSIIILNALIKEKVLNRSFLFIKLILFC